MKKKSILTMAISLALVGTISVGATMAYLSSSASQTNTFTVGNVAISQNENSEWSKVGTDSDFTNQAHPLIPGVAVAKAPQITITSNNVGCYLYMKVDINSTLQALLADESTNATEANVIAKKLGIDTTVWQPVNGYDNIYKYIGTNSVSGVVTGTPVIPALFSDVKIAPDTTSTQMSALNSGNSKITVSSFAIQSDALSSDSDRLAKATW